MLEFLMEEVLTGMYHSSFHLVEFRRDAFWYPACRMAECC
jgi:hypothetical protein